MNLAVSPAVDLLTQVQSLYDRSLYLQAYKLAEPLGPLDQWTGTRARVLAGRLANNLGAMRLGRVLHRLAFRADPHDPAARYFGVRNIFTSRGPWPAWQFCRNQRELPGATTEQQAEWLALHATILGLLRDFDRAEACLAQALELAPHDAWLWVEQAGLLDQADQRAAALESVHKALALQPHYRPAVQFAAHLLVQLNREREALTLLDEASNQIESGDVLLQLASLQSELELHHEARASLDRAQAFYPLSRYIKKFDQWLAARRSDLAYHCGEFDEAIRLARESDSPFHKKVAENLEQNRETGRRVLLPVGFVRQDYLTCVPATLTVLAEFWQQPVDHREVSESICYDGTPGHRERHWAEEHGYAAREFRVTLEAAVALIDRGIPFTLTTIGSGAAHLQAVIGYDTRRGSLLARDPGDRHLSEFLGAEMIEHFHSTGPRGMAMVPRARAAELASLELPESQLYDLSHALDWALEKHNRAEAHAQHQAMREIDPNHRLTLHSRGKIASYDSDVLATLQTTERLLSQFPKDSNLKLMQLRCLRELGRREERLTLLETICREQLDPLFWQQLAIELLDDSRAHERAQWLVRRAMLWRPQDGTNYNLLADLCWSAGQKDDALELYRFGACLDDKHEGRARAYFVAARNLRRGEEALEFLRERYARFGALSSWPTRTLCDAYEQLDRSDEGLELVQEALAQRPHDGDLALYAADMLARYGRVEAAQVELARAQAIAHATRWLRTSANIAGYRGDLALGLALWRQVLELEPLARDANDMVARLRGDLEGEEAAVAQLREAVDRFPHNLALRALLIERLGPNDPVAAEAIIRETVEIDPIDPWTRRELAIALTRLGRFDEALAEADLAEQLDPTSPVAEMIRARIFYHTGKTAEAKAAAERSLCLNVDYEPAFGLLMHLCQTKAEREAALRFMIEQLVAQVIFGDGLLTFLDYASRTLEPEHVERILRDAHAARPDLWHAWTALARHLTEQERYDEARQIARVATERFPLLPRIWVDLAHVCRAQGDTAGEIAALRQAQTINPMWGESARLLAGAYRREGKLAEALQELQRVATADPRDVQTLALLAQVLWELKEFDAALAHLKTAVRLEPGYVWAWDLLRDYCLERERRTELLEEARWLTTTRGHEARNWFRLAELLSEKNERAEAFAALATATEHNPQYADAYNLKAFYLAEEGRYEEALAVCHAPIFGPALPLELRSRAALIEAQAGRLDEAIAHMNAVVADDPDYHWAWNRLADWHSDRQELEAYSKAAEQLVRLAPKHAPSFGYRGDARLRRKDTAGAREAFLHALELDPAYRYGIFALIDLYLAEKQPQVAGEALEQYGAALDAAPRLSLAVRIAAARGDAAATEQRLAELAGTPATDSNPLHEALQAVFQAQLNVSVERVLEPVVAQPEASEHVILPYLEYLVAAGQSARCVSVLNSLDRRADMWHSATAYWFTEIAKEEKFTGFDAFFARHRRRVAEHTRTWSAAAHVLLMQGKNAEVIEWMQGWESRNNAEPPMLTPLVLAYWHQGQPQRAAEVARSARQLPGPPAYRSLLWLTCSEIIAGNTSAARSIFADVPSTALREYYLNLHSALAEYLAELDAPQSTSVARVATMLRNKLALTAQSDRTTWNLYHRLLARFAWNRGNFLRALYHRAQSL